MAFQNIDIRFLGTGTSQGVPVVGCSCEVCRSSDKSDKRLRASILIHVNGKSIVIDAGPDFRYQMLREEVKKLDAILITHSHKDHIAGLDDVRSFNYLQRKPMEVYASSDAQQGIKNEFAYAFTDTPYPGVPQINLHTIEDGLFEIEGITIQALRALHMRMDVIGFRIGDFAYITDTNYIPGTTLAQLTDCKVIVLNALRKEKHVSHYNLEEAIKVLEFLRPEQAYLTHISHLMGFHKKINAQLPEFIKLAYDGLHLNIQY